jgi:hypothetical protein
VCTVGLSATKQPLETRTPQPSLELYWEHDLFPSPPEHISLLLGFSTQPYSQKNCGIGPITHCQESLVFNNLAYLIIFAEESERERGLKGGQHADIHSVKPDPAISGPLWLEGSRTNRTVVQ